MSVVTERAPALDKDTLRDLAREAFERFQEADAEADRVVNIHLTAQAHRRDALRQFTGLARALEVMVVEWGDDPPFSREELESVVDDADADMPPAACPKLWRMACAAAARPRRY